MEAKTRNFRARLEKKWDEGKFVCVGLDPSWEKIPECVKQAAKEKSSPGGLVFQRGVVAFLRPIIEKTRDLVCAYKPNSAFFEEAGPEGMWTLAEVIRLIQAIAPEVPVIGDQKRADIGSTNKGYAGGAFDALEMDSVTVNPYFGGGSLAPFLDYEKADAKVKKGDKGVIVLCRTSNPEASEFQDRLTLVSAEELDSELKLLAAAGVTTAESMKGMWHSATMAKSSYKKELDAELKLLAATGVTTVDTTVERMRSEWIKATTKGKECWAMPFYQWVAIRFAARWNGHGNCALVVGATAPQELAEVRALVGDTMTLLLPGIGFQQKGTPLNEQVEQTVRAGKDSHGRGFIINASRSVLYASGGEDFAEAARAEVVKLNWLIEQYLK